MVPKPWCACLQVTDFFSLDEGNLATVEMSNLLLINLCALRYLPGG